jgi:hypothetical protein
MNKYYKVSLSFNLIKYETDRAYLFFMPHNSNYDGFSFWFPKSLCRSKGEYCVELSIPEDFNFKLEKRSKDKKILDNDSIDGLAMADQLSGHQQREESKGDDQSYLIVKEPKKKEVGKVIIPDDLKND